MEQWEALRVELLRKGGKKKRDAFDSHPGIAAEVQDLSSIRARVLWRRASGGGRSSSCIPVPDNQIAGSGRIGPPLDLKTRNPLSPLVGHQGLFQLFPRPVVFIMAESQVKIQAARPLATSWAEIWMEARRAVTLLVMLLTSICGLVYDQILKLAGLGPPPDPRPWLKNVADRKKVPRGGGRREI